MLLLLVCWWSFPSMRNPLWEHIHPQVTHMLARKATWLLQFRDLNFQILFNNKKIQGKLARDRYIFLQQFSRVSFLQLLILLFPLSYFPSSSSYTPSLHNHYLLCSWFKWKYIKTEYIIYIFLFIYPCAVCIIDMSIKNLNAKKKYIQRERNIKHIYIYMILMFVWLLFFTVAALVFYIYKPLLLPPNPS